MIRRWFPRAWHPPLGAALLLGLGVWLLQDARALGQTEEASAPPLHEVHVDGVGLLERTPLTVRLQKGDTVGGLAQRHLGRASRYREILALNPKLDVDALRVGQSVVLPPRTATGWTDLFAAVPGGIAQPVGLGAPALLPWGPVTIFAVPHARVEALRALDRDRQLLEPFLRADAQVARSAPFQPEAAVPGLARLISKLRVTGQRGDALDVVVLDQHRLSAQGLRVAPPSAVDAPRGFLVPLVLVGAGLVVFALIALAARRLGRGDVEGPSRRHAG